MTKKGLQGIATGILLATAIFSYMYFFQSVEKVESHKDAPTIPQLELSSEEMMEILSNQGFVVLEEDEYQSLLKEKDPAEVEGSNETVVYSSVLVIQPGMSSATVAEQLAISKIIDDASQFVNYLTEKNLTHKIKVGEFELDSGMTISEIAEIITK